MKQKKTISLLTESLVNGVYVREYRTFTLKEFEQMLAKCEQKVVKPSKSTYKIK